MKKKLLLTLMALICALACAFGLAACDGEPTHTHNYRWVDNGDGTHCQHCQNDGCDKQDINVAPHQFDKGEFCLVCGWKNPNYKPPEEHIHRYQWVNNGDGTHCRRCQNDGCDNPEIDFGEHAYVEGVCVCGSLHEHTFNMQRTNEPRYLAEEGTCQTPTKWYYSCECGEAGTETFESEYGYHKYVKQIAESKYLCQEANCEHKAYYYMSCECGQQGWETFEYGELGEHNFKNYQYNYDATCVRDGTETAYCSVCNEQHTRTKTESATGVHSYDYYIPNNDATCTRDGTETAHCRYCDHSDTRDIVNSKAHNFIEGKCEFCQAVGTNGLEYTLHEDGRSYYVSNAPYDESHVYISETYNDLPVTSIGENAFSHRLSLASITIPESITSIGYNAFYYCDGLANIYYPGTIAQWCNMEGLGNLMQSQISLHIGGEEVSGELVIPDGIISIGDSAFCGCNGIQTVTFGKDVKSIGSSAFSNCGFTSVTIPSGVTSIGNGAFRDCKNLTSITIPDTVEPIKGSAFWGCKIETATIPAHACNQINDSSNQCLETVVITSGEDIGVNGEGLTYCRNLRNLTIAASVKRIGDNAFGNCSELTVNYLGDIASWCAMEGLANLMVDDPEESYDNFLRSKISALYIDGVQISNELTIPDTVTTVCDYAFCFCAVNIFIPDSIIKIGSRAFYGKTDREVHYAGSLTDWCAIDGLANLMSYYTTLYIGDTTLSGELVIPDGVTSIGAKAFYRCSEITSVKIPASVKTIGGDAFDSCNKIASVHYDGSLADWCQMEGRGDLGVYNNTVYIGGQPLGDTLIIPDGVTKIGKDAFNRSSFTSVTIPDSVTSIGDNAFEYCRNLTSVTIPNSVKSVGKYAFRECSALASITIPDSVTSIGDGAFEYCRKLVKVTLGNGVTTIGSGAFSSCEGLKSITIPDSVMNIGDYAFDGCKTLTSITIPDSVKSVGEYAFRDCEALERATLGGGVERISAGTFYGCRKLETVFIPAGVTSIGDNAFSYCFALNSIAVPNSVTYIGGRLLYASGVTSIIFDGTVEQWNAIEKGYLNDNTKDYTIYCTDGRISKNGTVIKN